MEMNSKLNVDAVNFKFDASQRPSFSPNEIQVVQAS